MKPRTLAIFATLFAALALTALYAPSIDIRWSAAYMLTIPYTGYLLVSTIGPRVRLSTEEVVLLAGGAGYAAAVLTMLLLSYLPGGLSGLTVVISYGLLALLLLAVGTFLRRVSPHEPVADHTEATSVPSNSKLPARVLWGLLAVLVVAAALRLPNLGYSEFQDDEVSVVWHAAEAIQGRTDALLVHDKGPAEILLVMAPYAIADRINEQLARYPYALANLFALAAVFWLGRQLFGAVAGTVAALLLTVDGYFIGFARIVQYQSIVFLMVVLAIGVIVLYTRQPQAPPLLLYLAAAFLGVGALAHYEAILAMIPIGVLLVVAWRNATNRAALTRHVLLALLLGFSILLLFYLPFAQHPQFQRTLAEITGNRIGTSFPYNNLVDFFTRTIIYSPIYYFALQTVLLVAGLAHVYRRTLPRTYAILGVVLLIAGITLFFVNPLWLRTSRADLAWLFFVLAFLPAILLPGLRAQERALWLWLAVSLTLSLFFIQKPRTHVYNFIIPLALIGGQVATLAWGALATRYSPRLAMISGLSVVVVSTLIFANYGYWYFTYTGQELLRLWPGGRPWGYWTPMDEPQQNAIFGFPFKNGWKVVGTLYDQGILHAPFARNGKRGVANWYTRGIGDCSRDAAYYVYTPWNEPTNKGLLEPQARPQTANGFTLIHVVQVNGEPRLEIFEKDGPPDAVPVVHNVEDYERAFDANLSDPLFTAQGPSSVATIAVPLEFRLGEHIWLRGYTLAQNRLHPGDRVDLTLYWQTDQALTQSYKVFVQIIDMADDLKAGQRDGIPGCERFPTNQWQPQDVLVDTYSIVLDEQARPGNYTLLIGMYDADEERLQIFAPDDQPLGEALGIDTLFIEP